eukprot:GILI01024256.1.p1 GENE.GILI01024256.1~~GILI01024256.1.p1  ORF type:complete len:278 (+),score=55.28 GILI01024256.1:112-945(+)
MLRSASGVSLTDEIGSNQRQDTTPVEETKSLTHSQIAELSEAFRMLLFCGNAASGHHSAVINTDPGATMSATVSTMQHQHNGTEGTGNSPRSVSPPPGSVQTPTTTIGGHTGQGNATVVNSITTDQLSAILTSLGVVHSHHSTAASSREITSPVPASPGMKRGISFKGGFSEQPDVVSSTVKIIDDEFNGKISFTDFLVLLLRRMHPSDIDEMKVAFRYFDKNGTGTVTTNQFVEMFATMGEQSSPEEIDEMLAFADPESTGKIDYVAFLNNLAHSA